MQSTDAAKQYIHSLDLSGTRQGLVHQDANVETSVFEDAKTQAQVVGSSLFSFSKGVTAADREAISDSALLAQLVANKRYSVEKAPLDWYKTYGDVLGNVGWVMQKGAWNDYTTSGTAVEVHEKIIEVLTVALGPSAAALAIVKSALDALKAMQPGSSWLTIFSRESQKAKIARFQVGLVENVKDADLLITMLSCLIEAEKVITQVLFFKFKDERAKFGANAGTFSINRGSLEELAPAIRKKVIDYQMDYVSSITEL